MKREFSLSNASTFVSLRTIAKNVSGVDYETIEALPANTCVFENDCGQISISYENQQISFPRNKVKGLDIVPVTNAGFTFYAATIEFCDKTESVRYGIVVSPESELCWLRDSADKIGEVLSQPPLDLSQSLR